MSITKVFFISYLNNPIFLCVFLSFEWNSLLLSPHEKFKRTTLFSQATLVQAHILQSFTVSEHDIIHKDGIANESLTVNLIKYTQIQICIDITYTNVNQM